MSPPTLVVEAWPAAGASRATRFVYEQEGSAHDVDGAAPTTVELVTRGDGSVAVAVSASPVARAWVVRVHLRTATQRLVLAAASVSADDEALAAGPVRHLAPRAAGECSAHFPLEGAGARPACGAGAVAEFRLAASTEAREVEATIVDVAV